jgi:hypothetical protein
MFSTTVPGLYPGVAEPEPQAAGLFGGSRSWSQNIEVSAPASSSGSAKVVNKNKNSYGIE